MNQHQQERVRIIQELIDNHGLTTLVDFGINDAIYNCLRISKIVGIDINSNVKSSSCDSYYGDYRRLSLNFLEPNTLFTYFCFDKSEIVKFKIFLKFLRVKIDANSFLIRWLRYDDIQEVEIYDLSKKVNK